MQGLTITKLLLLNFNNDPLHNRLTKQSPRFGGETDKKLNMYFTYQKIGNATLIVTHAPDGEEVEYQVQSPAGFRSCYFDKKSDAIKLAEVF